MARYAVYICEGTFRGLHGISNTYIDDGNFKEVVESAIESSLELMDNYSCVDESLRDNLEIDDDGNYDENELESIRQENVDYNIYKIKDSCSLSDEELEKLFFENLEEFVKEYCVED